MAFVAPARDSPENVANASSTFSQMSQSIWRSGAVGGPLLQSSRCVCAAAVHRCGLSTTANPARRPLSPVCPLEPVTERMSTAGQACLK